MYFNKPENRCTRINIGHHTVRNLSEIRRESNNHHLIAKVNELKHTYLTVTLFIATVTIYS